MDHLDKAWAWFRGAFHTIEDDVIIPDGDDRIRHLNIAQPGVLGDGIHLVEEPFSVQAFARRIREALDGHARVPGNRPA